MLEIETKYRVADHGPVAEQLRAWGVAVEPAREEVDHYFNAPDRDFARTDEALRIRSIGPGNVVTYKGPKLDKETKTRSEIEVPLAAGPHVAEEFGRLLVHLKYRPVARLHKCRVVAHLQRGGFDLEVCLDSVDGVGHFVELEILAEPDRQAEAKAVLAQLAADLGLRQSERRSYLEMYLERQS